VGVCRNEKISKKYSSQIVDWDLVSHARDHILTKGHQLGSAWRAHAILKYFLKLLHLQSRSSNTVLNYCSTRSASIYNREKMLMTENVCLPLKLGTHGHASVSCVLHQNEVTLRGNHRGRKYRSSPPWASHCKRRLGDEFREFFSLIIRNISFTNRSLPTESSRTLINFCRIWGKFDLSGQWENPNTESPK